MTIIPYSLKLPGSNRDGGLMLELLQNRPSPFTSTTIVGMVIPKAGRVQLLLYDQMGRQVQILMDEFKAPGTYQVQVNKTNRIKESIITK